LPQAGAQFQIRLAGKSVPVNWYPLQVMGKLSIALHQLICPVQDLFQPALRVLPARDAAGLAGRLSFAVCGCRAARKGFIGCSAIACDKYPLLQFHEGI